MFGLNKYLEEKQMTPEQFCYWLQGYSELAGRYGSPNDEQWQTIQDHLNTVFNKVTKQLIPSKEPIAPYYPQGPGITGPVLPPAGPIKREPVYQPLPGELPPTIVC